MEYISIKHWALEERPREKLATKGANALSNAELLAILINTGTASRSALDISKDILNLCNNNLLTLGKYSLSDIKKIKGIGEKKAITLLAALELGKRRQTEDAKEVRVIKQSVDIFKYLQPYFMDLSSEEFYTVYLNQAGIVLQIEQISRGGITATVVDTRVVFSKALSIPSACRIIVAHNHPSGSLVPSDADKNLTKRLKEAGNLLDITLLDHLILAGNKYVSFADEGWL